MDSYIVHFTSFPAWSGPEGPSQHHFDFILDFGPLIALLWNTNRCQMMVGSPQFLGLFLLLAKEKTLCSRAFTLSHFSWEKWWHCNFFDLLSRAIIDIHFSVRTVKIRSNIFSSIGQLNFHKNGWVGVRAKCNVIDHFLEILDSVELDNGST